MTTSLDAYRSDREQLLARIAELEAEVARLTQNIVKTEPFEWLTACPRCGTRHMNGEEAFAHPADIVTYLGMTQPKFCRGFWQRLRCWFKAESLPRRETPHFHQNCTACGAHWCIDAKGWWFE